MDIYKIILAVTPVVISIVALVLSIKNVGYSRINMFNTIQKMILDKAKDCNLLYSSNFENWIKSPSYIGMVKSEFSYSSIVNEVYVSVKLLENTLNEFRIPHKLDFFILQYWYQLSHPIREYLRTFDTSIAQSGEEKQKKYLQDVFKKANVYIQH